MGIDVPVPVAPAARPGRRAVNPHLHLVALDGAWHEQGGELSWQGLGHLQTSEVGAVIESTVRRIERHLRRLGQPRRLRRLGPDATRRAASE